jgi:hypothetical protein
LSEDPFVTVRLDRRDMARRGRIGGYITAARYDGREQTAKARATFRQSFLDQVDPDRTLPEPERERRAEALRRAHYARLALASVRSRQRTQRPPSEVAKAEAPTGDPQ